VQHLARVAVRLDSVRTIGPARSSIRGPWLRAKRRAVRPPKRPHEGSLGAVLADGLREVNTWMRSQRQLS
jgi:hypothetical protein